MGFNHEQVLVVGSGGREEKHRPHALLPLQGRGMSWSQAGAQNVLKLRFLRYDRTD